MLKKLLSAAALFALIFPVTAGAEQDAEDPFLWLEEVEGESALNWVKAQNTRSLAELEADPRFDDMYQEALAVLTSDARLPLGDIHGSYVYNFWVDETHVRGIWRRSTLEAYASGEPNWETVLDFDKLAADEGENWIHGDIVCLNPEYRHCMIEMSYGGKDAAVWREFDTRTKTFVEGGFYLPEAKSFLDWADKDTLLVGTDTGEGSLTDSGYPRTIRILKRGQTLTDAPVWFEGEASDVWVYPVVEHDDDETYLFAGRGKSFFETEMFFTKALDGEKEKLNIPLNADYSGVFHGRKTNPLAIYRLREDFDAGERTYFSGSLVGVDLETGALTEILRSSDKQPIQSVGIGEDEIFIQYLDDVSGKAARLRPGGSKGGWQKKQIKLPENGVINLVSVGDDEAVFTYESMNSPTALYFVSDRNKAEKIDQMPAFFDAEGVVVEQRFATSKDGTKVPYYVMGKEDVLESGNAPTIQYGYGGFLVPILPVYYEDPSRPQHGALAGSMWVKRGGVLVLSNIRGGSEYGPGWHQGALKENRQKAFDDFIAISEDLIERGITSPEKLGAIGRSNGGLLMGAMLTQRPDLYAALDIGVPLLDMKRYNKLLAGASWMGEYGNPDLDDEWAYISQYSPYQKIVADQPYPKVLFYTSTKDDRVHPGHARKAAAKLDDLGYEFYYYENIEGGHGGTANQDQLAHRTALEYVYFAKMLMGD
ncbi:prolyl oligopeptidase family serine peptidase [Hyphococcus formosus]|uniref:prolyl oligopeptidase family serine peptidase n=1 Tax=Hyphococcus formosus TaxID=3143534 RepID=UPI00398B52D3